MSITQMVVYSVLGLVALILLIKSFVLVRQQEAKIIERLGKFNRVLSAGLHMKIPFVEKVIGTVSLRVEQLEVPVETKTKDNVIVSVSVAVQYRVPADMVRASFYELDDPEEQIQSYVLASIRGEVPKMDLDDLYQNKDQVASAVEGELTDAMTSFGYKIVTALVTDIDPDEKVKAAMNDINAAVREREAATARGDADKTLTIKAAEAEAERMRLEGEGVANQRKAIATGLKDAMETLKETGITPAEAQSVLVTTQYFDALRDISSSSKTNTIFLQHGPGVPADLEQQVRAGVLSAQATNGTGSDN